MTSKQHLHHPFSTAGIVLLVLAVASSAAEPLLADATVYRCGTPGNQSYSQIPCTEDAEPLVIRDQHMLSSETLPQPAATGEGNGSGQAPSATQDAEPANNAEAFIQQLEKQRSEQLAEIDRNIARLESRGGTAGGEESQPDADETAALLASMQNARESIVSEYDAMIRAARQRVAKP